MNESKAICPRCGKEVALIAAGGAKVCPECGSELEPQPASAPSSNWLGVKGGWFLPIAFLIGPAVLTFAVVMVTAQVGRDVLEFGAPTAVIGSAVSALVCGIWYALRTSKKVGWRILLSLLLVPVFYVVCLGLSFAGCVAASNLRNAKQANWSEPALNSFPNCQKDLPDAIANGAHGYRLAISNPKCIQT